MESAFSAASLYQFVRDEHDRDLLRQVLLESRYPDKLDFDKWFKAVNLPAEHEREIREALDDLSKLDDKDWKAKVSWLRARSRSMEQSDWQAEERSSSGITVNITLRQDDTPSLVDVTPTPPVIEQDSEPSS